MHARIGEKYERTTEYERPDRASQDARYRHGTQQESRRQCHARCVRHATFGANVEGFNKVGVGIFASAGCAAGDCGVDRDQISARLTTARGAGTTIEAAAITAR